MPEQMLDAAAGFNMEKVQYKNVLFTVWDVGGKEKLRPAVTALRQQNRHPG